MDSFTLNGDVWRVRMVDWGSNALVDRTDNLRLATTDPNTMTIYLSNRLSGSLLSRVLIHEIGHAVMWSYDLFGELHRMVKPEYWIEAEEWICNFIADYGMTIFARAARVMGGKALTCIPAAMENLVA